MVVVDKLYMARSFKYLRKLEIAKQRYIDGESINKIAKEMKMSPCALRNNLRDTVYKNSNIDTTINVDIFEKIDTPEKAYWFGLLSADGNVANNNNKIEVTLKEEHHLQKLKEFINTRTDVKPKDVNINGKIKRYYRLSFANKKIHDDLIKNGCIPKKSLTLKFPTEKQVPRHLINHYMRGYFDGDGCIHKYDYECSLVISIIGTYDFLEEFKKIYDMPNNKYISCGKAYEYKTAAKECVYRFLDLIYEDATIYLERKYAIYKQCRFS